METDYDANDELDCWFGDIYENETTRQINLSDSDIKTWIKQLKDKNDLSKIFDNLDEEDIQNYLRIKKIKRIQNKI